MTIFRIGSLIPGTDTRLILTSLPAVTQFARWIYGISSFFSLIYIKNI